MCGGVVLVQPVICSMSCDSMFIHDQKGSVKQRKHIHISNPVEKEIISHFQYARFSLCSLLSCIDFPPFMLFFLWYTILACRHGNMDTRCIHFSNKKKKRFWGIGVREACVLCLHPHSDLSNKRALLPPPPTFSNQLCVSLTGRRFRITCSFSNFLFNSVLQGWKEETRGNNYIAIEYRLIANM